MTQDDPLLRAQLIDHEGLRLKPYTDTVGKLTIGVGRNLTDVGISHDEAMLLLDRDLLIAIADCATFGWWFSLSPVRQRAMADMRFNLGPMKFRQFRRTLAALERGDYVATAEGMRESVWARQTGRRVRRLAAMMETGTDPGLQ